MKAFFNTVETNHTALHRIETIRDEGQFYAYGMYWDGKKGNISGCVYNCFLKPQQPVQDCPKLAETIHGIPWQFMEIVDKIFSGLYCHQDKALYQQWPIDLYSAIRPGADLLPLRDLLAYTLLQDHRWCYDFASEEFQPQVELMENIYYLKTQWIDQSKRMKDYYFNHLRKFYRHHYDGRRVNAYHAHAAMKSLCTAEQGWPGPFGHFLESCVEGRIESRNNKRGECWKDLSKMFLQMVKDC